MTDKPTMSRTAWNYLSIDDKAAWFKAGGTVFDEPPDKEAAELARNAAIAGGAITRALFDSLDEDGKRAHLRTGKPIVD